MVDQISEQRLQLVHPDLARRVRAAVAQLEAVGTYVRVAEGVRSYVESDRDYAQGRTAPGHIITNARGGFSQHNHGFAVDCYPFLRGCPGELNFKAATPQFKAMVQAFKQQGLLWGGDWQTIVDPPHFQLAGIPVTPTAADRAAFARGGIEAVWALYSGKVSLQASAMDHFTWRMLLGSAIGGGAQWIGHWLMEHFGRRLLTRFRKPCENTPPVTQRPEGETMKENEQNEPGVVEDLQAGAFGDFVHGVKKFFNVTPNQQQAAETAVVSFVGKDGLNLAVDAVKVIETKLPGAAGVDKRNAAVAQFKADAATAKLDLAHLGSEAFNFVIEGALQIAISKGLEAAATVALHAGADEPKKA